MSSLRQPRVAVRVRLVDRQRHLDRDLAVFGDFKDSLVASLGDHCVAVRQPLKAVDFDRPFVPFLGPGAVRPDFLALVVHFDNLIGGFRVEDVAVVQDLHIVGDEIGLNLPLDFAVLVEKDDPALDRGDEAVCHLVIGACRAQRARIANRAIGRRFMGGVLG